MKNKPLLKIIVVLIITILLIGVYPSSGKFDNNFNFSKLNPQPTRNKQNKQQAQIIIYSARQDWPPMSRLYLLRMDGTVIDYFEYSNVRFCDFEVVDNELYVVEALCPLVYKVDIETGDLEQIIFDLSLIYLYDLAFDGTYFYCVEWDLIRYDINGNKQGTAGFDETVFGSAWDGDYYWTIDDSNQVRCWDISNWPTITEIQGNMFTPPTAECRGLWFDGQYFWTAESISGVNGKIYRFDYDGSVISQWDEPIFSGWAACVIEIDDEPPDIPDSPSGPSNGRPGVEYIYSTSTIDPEGHKIYYKWDWDDGSFSDWLGPYNSGTTIQKGNIWSEEGIFEVRVKARDEYLLESEWSDPLIVTIGFYPPEAPIITGPNSGKPGISYTYTFVSTNPEGNDILEYIIDWGDNTEKEIITGPFASGEQITSSHTWTKQGTFEIKAKVKDIYGAESDWGDFNVNIPRSRFIKNSFFLKLPLRFFLFFQQR
jgi:hypothetical protein